jgi:uncharacterized protein YkwD
MKARFLLLLSFFLASPLFAAEKYVYKPGKLQITAENVLAQMNLERKQAGLGPLFLDARLSAAAEDRMKDMEELGYWAHQAPDGRSPFLWLAPHGYTFANAGENLAAGFETAEILVMGWMESPGHRANILSPLFQHVGIAIIDGTTTKPAVGKSIVVLFARPLAMEVAAR